MKLETLQTEMYSAMKNKDNVRKDVLSNLISAVKKAAIDKQCKDNITEQLTDEVILKEKKLLQEMIDTCPADRYVKKSVYELQMQILNEYAPKIITDRSTIRRLIHQCCRDVELTKSNRGLVMKTLALQLKGKADMKVVSDVVGGMLL